MRKLLNRYRKLKRRLLFAIASVALFVLVSAPGVYREMFLGQPLWLAAQKGQTAEVKRLLAAGADPNATWEDGTSALKVAHGHPNGKEIVQALWAAGAKE